MEERYEVTIIVSCYNQERHLAETIESVLAQKTDFPYQVLITDDYSLDRSPDIIREYEREYANIEAIFGDENRGYLANVLRAKARTKTRYFCLLDAEDYWTDPCFLQRAHDFLETHGTYSVYEANVEVVPEGLEGDEKSRHPFLSPKFRSGTYTKEMFLRNETVPITQTTGMFFRNCIFADGIPEIMAKAVGTRSERAFEGDTGRLIMHLKHGPAWYDRRIVGVYRLTKDGIWNRLSEAEKSIITARMQVVYEQYYGCGSGFFVNKAYRFFQRYLSEKQKELEDLSKHDVFVDEEERLMAEDVYQFCRQHEKEIIKEQSGLVDKAKKIYRIVRA